MQPLYPIRAVSKLTGLPIDTLRAWERRYRAVTPSRADRGRLYSEADVRRLILLRTAVESGQAIGRVASLPDPDLEELARGAKRTRVSAGLADGGVPAVLSAIEAFDYDAATDELARLAMLATPRALVYEIVLPLMHTAGEYWMSGRFQVSQEHLLSACVRNLVGGMLRARSSRRGGRLLFTTPSGELHEFGILAAAMLAIAHDFQVACLGPSLPAAEIVQSAGLCSARAVVLGIMETNVNAHTAAEIAILVSALRAPVELWLGGSGAAYIVESAGVRTRKLESRGLDILPLDNFQEFERQLRRLKNERTWEPAE